MYMSSKQWLKKHGLKKLNLTVYTFLKGLVFSHCDGVLETQRPCIENETSVRFYQTVDILGPLSW